jgi:hypothetical protein
MSGSPFKADLEICQDPEFHHDRVLLAFIHTAAMVRAPGFSRKLFLETET